MKKKTTFTIAKDVFQKIVAEGGKTRTRVIKSKKDKLLRKIADKEISHDDAID